MTPQPSGQLSNTGASVGQGSKVAGRLGVWGQHSVDFF